MSKLLTALQTNDSRTYNGAVTHSTSGSALVDLFFLAGASRNVGDQEILNAWIKSVDAEPILSLQLLLWARDCRGGAGERRFFRTIYQYLKGTDPEVAARLTTLVPEFGRYDDLIKSGELTTAEMEVIAAALNDGNGLAAKWVPRRGTKFHQLAAFMGMNLGDFRRFVVGLSNTVEQHMSAREFSAIDYKGVPSVAMARYSKSFGKHDATRFAEYMTKVKKGEVKINAATLFPYDLIRSLGGHGNVDTINEQWKALPDYYTDENILVVADVSGSMTCGYSGNIRPIDISISLAMYTAERNRGIFRDNFITFSGNPTLQTLKGSFTERFNQLRRADWAMNTNIQAVFDLILGKAKGHNLSAEDMPTKVIIVSDMEFDYCGQNTNTDVVRQKYEAAGFQLPQLVFWNVNGRTGNSPVKIDSRGVALVSGASPAILKSVLGEDLSPLGTVLKTIDVPRYQVFG